MDFNKVVDQVIALLKRQGRVSYSALRRRFEMDDAYLSDLKDELLYVHESIIESDDRGFTWTRETEVVPCPDQSVNQKEEYESRLHAALPFITALLQRQGRVTYRTVKHAFGLNDKLLTDICDELHLRQIAVDEGGKVLVCIDKVQREPLHVGIPPNKLAAIPEPTRHVSNAERRQLTVMFCDLVDSTGLSARLDPEDLRDVVRAYQETAAAVIERYQGHIAQYLGDGLLIYFGFPLAHEDDAQRAVYTGLGMTEAMVVLNIRLEADYGVQLAVRIGIHTGRVVIGEMGGGGRHENLALGETPNIAARLEGLAQPNTVVISSVTAQLVQPAFSVEELGLHDLKGVAEPMMLYAVVGSRESKDDDHEAMLSGGFDALVGRDEEIGLLLRRWEQSKEGQGQVVLISGDAGLGKSSLVEGLRAHVRQEDMTRLTFRCSPYTANSAFYPVIECVQRVLGWQRDDPPETRLAKLEQRLSGYQLPQKESLIPLLAALLSLSLPEARYPRLTLTAQQQRQQTQDVLVAWMLEEAEHQPVLMVWEDLHWADPSTLELLGLFIEQTPTVPMLHVLATRPELVPPWPMQSHLTPITLNRLERSHAVSLVRRLAGGKRLPSEVESHIITKTDGVPLYVEELTKMLLESDLLKEEPDHYVLTGSLSSASIPATLQDSLMARLDRLPEVREVAQLGAVLGREFSYSMIQALTAMDEAALQSGLSRLVSTELLYQRGRIPQAKYIFRHVLIRDAAYQSLLRRTRQRYHQRIAEVLEARFVETVEQQPELLAYHYTEAGLDEQAVTYWQRAGQRASDRSAYPEAISHLTTGLNLLQVLPETLERHQQELPLQMALAVASRIVKGHLAPEVKTAYKRARVLCQQLGDTQDVFPVLHGLYRF